MLMDTQIWCLPVGPLEEGLEKKQFPLLACLSEKLTSISPLMSHYRLLRSSLYVLGAPVLELRVNEFE